MKTAHVLRGSKTTALPRNFIFFDAETERTSHKNIESHFLKVGCASFVRIKDRDGNYSNKNLTFYDNDTFWDAVEEFTYEKSKTLIYAHNTHFDYFVTDGINMMKDRGWELKTFFINSNVFIMVWKKGTKKIVVLDSGNIIKIPLKVIGKVIGIEKLEIDFDTCTMEELTIYCQVDVDILREFIIYFYKFVSHHDLGTYRHTIAAQALEAFSHRFMNDNIYIHNSKPVIELERKAYFGGRTEALFLGKKSGEKFFLVDVNSMYPYVMKNNKFPRKLHQVKKNISVSELKKIMKTHSVTAKVEIDCKKPVYPFKLERTLFVTGNFQTILSSPEIEYALENNLIKKVRYLATYERGNIFEKYVDFFYRLKKKYKSTGNKVMYMLTKLFLNSLYGKFGQKSRGIKQVGQYDKGINFIENVYNLETKTKYMRFLLAGKEFIQEKERESFNSFVGIAAHVTAYARMYLWKLIEIAGVKNVYYMDTDSLLVNTKGLKKLKKYFHPTELGALDVEKEMDNFNIKGLKDYEMGDKVKIKGIKGNALLWSELTKEQQEHYMKILDLADPKSPEDTYVQLQFMKFRSMLRKGVSDAALVRTVVKQLTRAYKKGHVQKDGRVKPYNLPEDMDFLTSL